MEKFLTIGFLSKLSLKKRIKDEENTDEETLKSNLDRAKKNLRSFINKQ